MVFNLTQSYELHNVGESAVSYEVDVAPLQALTESNYLMPILQCLQAEGEVPPRGSTAIPFIFSPMEVKEYSVSNFNSLVGTCDRVSPEMWCCSLNPT